MTNHMCIEPYLSGVAHSSCAGPQRFGNECQLADCSEWGAHWQSALNLSATRLP